MFTKNPLDPSLLEMAKMIALQRETDKTTSFSMLGRMDSVERRILEDTLAQHKKIEELKRQLGGVGTTELARWLEESRKAKIQDFRKPRSVIDEGLGLPKHFLYNPEHDRLVQLAAAQKHLSLDSFSVFQSAFAASAVVAEALSATRAMIDIDRMKLITKPWENATRATRTPALSPLTAVLASFTEMRAYLPFIDATVACQIANHWHHYGVEQEIRTISERYEKLLEDDAPSKDEIEEFSRVCARFSEKKGLDFSSFLNLMLVLAVLWYQENSSSQMEERLTTKIEAGQTQQRQRDTESKVFQASILLALKHVQPSERGQTVFVVQDRFALAKKEALSGAPVIGSLVPNQTAILLEEKGNWIRVEYFDWHSQSARQGWVLKKYLSRVAAQ
ncbi:MAG: SH3 domain-containing protein [Sideroxyarcus sp.]|nr:SH3 domain-containing protein [Sideroxyarcus sp.]